MPLHATTVSIHYSYVIPGHATVKLVLHLDVTLQCVQLKRKWAQEQRSCQDCSTALSPPTSGGDGASSVLAQPNGARTRHRGLSLAL